VKILFAGTNDALDFTRRQLLASAGYVVVDVRDPDEAAKGLTGVVSLAVISNMVKRDDQIRIAAVLASQSPDTLFVNFSREEAANKRGHFIPPLLGPEEFLKQVGVALMKQHRHPEISSKYFMFVDRDRRYINVSDGVCELLKWSREEILGKTIDWLTYPNSADAPVMFRHYIESGEMVGSYVLRCKTGEPVNVTFKATVLPDGCMCSELSTESG
jgi:hypothetical protein